MFCYESLVIAASPNLKCSEAHRQFPVLRRQLFDVENINVEREQTDEVDDLKRLASPS
jgi:hypothetical protein